MLRLILQHSILSYYLERHNSAEAMAPGDDHPASWAGKLLLEWLPKNNDELACKFIGIDDRGREVMHCFVDCLDLGSMIIQMGVAEALE